jgi:tRNA dimethylallyltransferase
MNPQQRLLVIVGPTAVGKTAVGIECARRLGGEIVSADAMQIYRGMDIGTAKPTVEERALVPHHLFDIADPQADFSVALYKELAEAAIDDIFSRSRQPILVGGSGLYVKAVIGRMGLTIAPKDPDLRVRLQNEAREKGLGTLHLRLARIDPEAAARIAPADEKRIIRALEVYELTGLPISHFHRLDRERTPKYRTFVAGLSLSRPVLYEKIETRIDQMLAAGLLEEIARLLAEGCHPGLISMKALGYSHLARHLAGELDWETTVARFKQDTRRFAKRQLTWFRAMPEVRWWEMDNLTPVEAAEKIIKEFQYDQN